MAYLYCNASPANQLGFELHAYLPFSIIGVPVTPFFVGGLFKNDDQFPTKYNIDKSSFPLKKQKGIPANR
jgi:hypothetical protein